MYTEYGGIVLVGFSWMNIGGYLVVENQKHKRFSWVSVAIGKIC
jgi:hypothetical protein